MDTPSLRGGSQRSLRQANADRVLDVLRAGPASQAEVVRASGLSGATVSTIVRDLLQAGTAEAVDGGSRGQAVALSRRAGVAAGIAFGTTRGLVVLGDLTGARLGERAVPLPDGLDADGACSAAVAAVDALLAAAGLDRGALLATGVGLPAPVRTGGRPEDAAARGRWTDVDVQERLRAVLPCTVLVDNDANLGARAEARWGALRGRSVGAWVKASGGIGVGLLLQGQVHRGAKGTAGELGHTSTSPDGPLCRCGGRGCLELTTAGPALTAEYAACTGRHLSTSGLVEAARAGDAVAARLVDEAGARLGSALAPLVTLLDPEVLVLGGDLAGAGDLLLDPLAAALRSRAMPAVVAGVAVTTSELGDRAEVLGALALALHASRPLRPAAVAP